MVYPITILSSWLLASIIETVEVRQFFVSKTVKKSFIDYRGPGDCSIKYTPLVRINAFVRHTNKGLSAIVNDSSHKIAVFFTETAIARFEAKYSQRLTYHSFHSLVILRKASLKFINNDNHQDFKNAFRDMPPHMSRRNSAVYLEVDEVDFFSRDQHSVALSAENMLVFVYVEPEYQRRFMADDQQRELKILEVKKEDLAESIVDEYDGMVSEMEEEECTETQRSGSSAGSFQK